MSEDEILAGLLRRILSPEERDRGYVGFDRFPQGDGMICIDTSWVDLSTEEAEVVDRLTGGHGQRL